MVPPNTNTNTIADAYLNRLFQELLQNSMTSFTRIVCHVICNQETISLIGLESEPPRFSTVRYVWGPLFSLVFLPPNLRLIWVFLYSAGILGLGLNMLAGLSRIGGHRKEE